MDGMRIKRHLRVGGCTFKVTSPRVARLAPCLKNNDGNSVDFYGCYVGRRDVTLRVHTVWIYRMCLNVKR